jgi:hypothetical protein
MDRSFDERSFDELEAILQLRTCHVRTARTTGGQCGLEGPASCAPFRFFPQVAQAIQPVNNNHIHQYIKAIRRNVCPVCQEQALDGSGEARRQFQGTLDRYPLLEADAIEEAAGKNFDKTSIRTLPAGPAARPGPQIRL